MITKNGVSVFFLKPTVPLVMLGNALMYCIVSMMPPPIEKA